MYADHVPKEKGTPPFFGICRRADDGSEARLLPPPQDFPRRSPDNELRGREEENRRQYHTQRRGDKERCFYKERCWLLQCERKRSERLARLRQSTRRIVRINHLPRRHVRAAPAVTQQPVFFFKKWITRLVIRKFSIALVKGRGAPESPMRVVVTADASNQAKV